MSLTGFGLKISSLIEQISGGNLLFTLLLAMFASVLLGMGLPLSLIHIFWKQNDKELILILTDTGTHLSLIHISWLLKLLQASVISASRSMKLGISGNDHQ